MLPPIDMARCASLAGRRVRTVALGGFGPNPRNAGTLEFGLGHDLAASDLGFLSRTRDVRVCLAAVLFSRVIFWEQGFGV